MRHSPNLPISQRTETPVGRSRRGTGFAAVSSQMGFGPNLSRRLASPAGLRDFSSERLHKQGASPAAENVPVTRELNNKQTIGMSDLLHERFTS